MRSWMLPLAVACLLSTACSTRPPAATSAEPLAPPAPAAPETAVTTAAPTAADVVTVSGSRLREATTLDRIEIGGEAAASRVGSAEIGPPAPRAGILTAGDYDDLLNPTLYARYAERYLQDHPQAGPQSALPFVDARKQIRVRVTDSRGVPVPFARVTVGDARLDTAADGSAVFFPALDHLPATLAVTVEAHGHAVHRTIAPSALPADRTVSIEWPVAAPRVAAFDLLLAIDTTGSMGDELAYLQGELNAIVAGLRKQMRGVDLLIGLIVYRDEGDEYVVRSFPFTGDIPSLRTHLAAQQATGGGDYPEAVEQALAQANRFEWRAQAVKAMLFVADAPPHADRMAAAWRQVESLRKQGVHIVPVAASGVADDAQYLMRSMAVATQSRYLFLTDDSGVGLPHEDPDVACYVVTHLDGLIQRVLAGLLTGRRIEPGAGEVLRTVGDYDRGTCLPAPRTAQPSRHQGRPE